MRITTNQNCRLALSIALLCNLVILSAQEKNWTLQSCITHAIQNNITYKQSALDVQNSEIATKEAFGNFLPTLNGSVSNFWNSGLATDPRTNTNSTQTFRSSSYGLQLGVNLFDGLRNVRQFQRSKIDQLRNQYMLGKAKDDVILLVANSYLQVLLNKESLKVIEKQHQITIAQLARTQQLVESGVLPQGDVLEIEATAADEQTRIVQARNAIQIALINLAQTLLIKDYEKFDIEDQAYLVPRSELLEKPVSQIIAKARETRYEVQIAEQNRLLAQKDLEISKGAYLPTLTGSLTYSTSEVGTNTFAFAGIDPVTPILTESIGVVENTGQNVINNTPNLLLKEVGPTPFIRQLYTNDRISFGFSLSVPIWNGFSIRNTVKRREIALKRSAFQLEQANLDLDSNVYQAYLDAKAAAQTYEAATVAVKAQERAYAYAKDRFDVGLTNAFDFSQSKFRLENAQSNAVRAKFDYIFKIKVLELFFGIKIADLKL